MLVRPVNNDATHKMIDIEEADGLDQLDLGENRGDVGDIFPGASSNSNFNSGSYPNSNTYGNQETGISVENIYELNGTIISDISVKTQNGYAICYDEKGISGRGFGTNFAQYTYGGVLFDPPNSGNLVQIGVVAQELETAVMSGLVSTSNPSQYEIKHDASFGTLYEDGDDIPNGLLVGEVKEIKES